MSKRRLLPVFAPLLAASLMAGTSTRSIAQDHRDHQAHEGAGAPANSAAPFASRKMRWSDPAAWPQGRVPREHEAVVIGREMDLLLDIDPPALRSLTIDGKLTFADGRDIELETDWIYLRGGELHIGTEQQPHKSMATITLTDRVRGEDINTMGDRGIMLMGGALRLHGEREHAWSKLADTAPAGATRIEVLDARGWRAGDQIVLASTDFDPRQAEKRTIVAIAGNTITLDAPLAYMHYGQITFGVDQRAEVGLLSRNIRIQASADAETSYFGGHIMAMLRPDVRLSGVELRRMGQHLTLARYPIHWHLVGEGEGQYIKNSAIHDTYNRCVTVHGTNNVLVENNVTFNTVGHCFFLEDAVETGNRFVRNLGIMTKCHPTLPCIPTNLAPGRPITGEQGQRSPHVLIPSDNTVATFWITNPDNIYRDNVAAGSDQIGFWFALPIHPTGEFEGTEISANTWPRRTRVREFKGNTAHSTFDGLMFDRGPRPDGTFSVAGSNYHVAYSDPADPTSQPLESVFEDFTGYKNRNGAIWGRGELHLFKNLRLADNAIGFTHAASAPGRTAYTSKVVNSLFVGESDNIGNPRSAQEIAYGRSLPSEHADFPIRGYEYYDFRHDVENVSFVNFVPNSLRDAGAISYLMYTSFGMSTLNSISGARFENAKPVSFPQIVRRWASDFGRRAAWAGAAFRDLDGSVGGIAGGYIVIDNGLASDEDACQIRPDWNAAVCRGDMGRLSVAGNFGFGDEPIEDPVVFSRNGRRFEYIGETTIRSGAEVRVETARRNLTLGLREMAEGAFVIFHLPGFGAGATGDTGAGAARAMAGAPQPSLAALREARTTAHFRDGDSLWIKLVADNEASSAAIGPGQGSGSGSGSGSGPGAPNGPPTPPLMPSARASIEISR